MKKAWWTTVGLVVALTAAASIFVVPAALADPPDTKVTFCHRTGATDSNPYVLITTAEAAWLVAHQPGANHPDLDGRQDIKLHDGEQTEKDSCPEK